MSGLLTVRRVVVPLSLAFVAASCVVNVAVPGMAPEAEAATGRAPVSRAAVHLTPPAAAVVDRSAVAVAARVGGKPVRVRELPGLRSESSSSFLMSDGSVQVALSPSPVHFLDADESWRPIDTGVVPGEGAAKFVNETNTAVAEFGLPSGELVQLTSGGSSVAMSPVSDGAVPVAASNGSRVRFANVFGGSDVRYSVVPGGVKEDIVLRSPESVGPFSFELTAEGLVAEESGDGSIGLFADAGDVRPVFVIPPSFMYDSGPDGGVRSDAVTQTLSTAGGRTVVTVTPDADWLNAKSRVFPVVVDPSILVVPVPAAAQDAAIFDGSPNTVYPSDALINVGNDSAQNAWRGLFKFDTSVIPANSVIRSADLNLHFNTVLAGDGNTVPVSAHQVTAPWSEGSATWSLMNSQFVAAQGFNRVVVDDGDTGATAFTGSWKDVADSNAVGGSHSVLALATGANTFEWNARVPGAGDYKVEAFVLPAGNRGTPLYVVTGDAGSSSSIGVNQTTGATTGVWKDVLASHHFAPSLTARVKLTRQSGTTATAPSADAVRLTEFSQQTKTANQRDAWHSFAVGSTVQQWVDGSATNYGLMVKGANDSNAGPVGGPSYQAAEDAFGGETANRPQLLVTYEQPGVVLNAPTVVRANGAELSWSRYIDPSTADGDDLVEYQVFRGCISAPVACQGTTTDYFTSSTGPALVGTVASDTTTFTDTSASASTNATAAVYNYWVVARTVDDTRNGQNGRAASNVQRVTIPREGRIVRVLTGDLSDTTLASGTPTTNLDKIGTRNWLQVGNAQATYAKQRALLEFDTSAIRAKVKVTDARLELFESTGGGTGTATFDVHALTRDFIETQATWGKATSTIGWTALGGDFEPAVLASVSTDNAPKRLTFTSQPLKDKVQLWVNDTGLNNHGFLLKARDETVSQQWLSIVSSESSDSMFTPRLVVEHLVKNDDEAIEANQMPQRFVPGTIETTPVTVTNTSSQTWPATLQLSYRWTEPGSTVDITVPGDRNYVDLGRALEPGESVALYLRVRTPINADSGSKRLAYDLYLDLWNPTSSTWWSAANAFAPTTAPSPPCSMVATGLYCPNRYVEDPTSKWLGLEKFMSYTGEDTGGGGQLLTNLFSGNAAWSYDAFSNPSLGPSAFLRLSINSQDSTDVGAGYGVSVQPATMTRLGDILSVPSGQSTSNLMTFVDGDGTRHTYKLKSQTSSLLTYDRPAGVALDLTRDLTIPGDPAHQWVFTRPDGTRFYFNQDTGQQTSVVDRNGNTLSFTYTAGKLSSVTDQSGRAVLTLGYDAAGLVYVRDISGRALKFTYNGTHQLVKLQDGGGYNASTGTFGAGEPVKEFDFTYTAAAVNSNAKLATVEDPLNNISRVFYHSSEDPAYAGWVKQFVDRRTHVTDYSYTDPDSSDAKGIEATVTDVNGATPSRTIYAMDGYGRSTAITDAKGQVTRLGWDADHNVIRLEEANGAVSTWTYDPVSGYPTRVRDAESIKNNTPAVVFDWRRLSTAPGQPWVLDYKTSAQGRKNRFTYDAKGNLASTATWIEASQSYRTDYSYTYFANGTLDTATDAKTQVVKYANYDANGYPTKITDPMLFDTLFSYDNRGQVVQVTDALTQVTTASYDAFGRPTVISTPGSVTAPATVATPRSTATVYDLNDNVKVETAPNTAVTSYTYDAADNLMTKTLPSNGAAGSRVMGYTYDDLDRLATETAPAGTLTTGNLDDYVTNYFYDQIGQLEQVENPFLDSTSTPRTAITEYKYDVVGNQTTVIDPNRSSSAAATDFTTSTAYDLNHRPTSVTDAAGYTVRNEYDRDGLLTAEIDALGNRKRTVYDEYGRPIETHVPHTPIDGVTQDWVTKTEYDLVGNVTKVIRPDGNFDKTDYDANNRPTVTTNADGGSTKTEYDKIGQVFRQSLPYKQPALPTDWTTYTYHPSGDVKTSTDPYNIVTSYEYNELGQQRLRTLKAASDSATRVQASTYWPDGSMQSKADTAAQQPVDVIDNTDGGTAASPNANWATVAGGTNTIGTNYRTHAASTSGTANDTFSWTFNPDVGGTFEVWASCPVNTKATTAATYTVNAAAGSTNKTVNQKACTASTPWVSLGSHTFNGGTNKTVTLKPASAGLVLADAVKFVATDPPPTRSFTYDYNVNGLQTDVKDLTPGAKVDTYHVDYDGLDRTSRVKELLAGNTKRTTDYTYDLNSNPLTSSSTRPMAVGDNEDASRYLAYTWDVRNLVATVKAGDTAASSLDTFAYTYDPRGMLSTLIKVGPATKPLEGNVTTYRYFENGLAKSSAERTSADNGSKLVAQHRLTWFKSGDIKQDISKVDDAGTTGYLDQTADYTYTPGRKLTGVTKTGGDASLTETYAYDDAGNVKTQKVKGVDSRMTYVKNRLTQTEILNASGTVTSTSKHQYDAFGRASSIDVSGQVVERFAYDGYDRLVRNQQWDSLGTFQASTATTYDPFDRTTSQTSKIRTNNPVTTRFVYLGLADQVAVEEQQNNGGTYEVSKRYAYGPGGDKLSLIDTPVNDTTTDTFYYGTNLHGDIETLTKAGTGQTTSTYRYTAYGSAEGTGTTGGDALMGDPVKDADIINPYRYSSGRFNGTTSTYDMGFREYSPGLNRYLTRDMYSGALSDMALGADPWNTNRYALAGGNPISFIDLDGHWGITIPSVITNTVSAAVDTVSDTVTAAADTVSDAATAVGDFVVEHKATIAGIATGIVVYAGCTGATLGGGAVACAAVAGAAGSVVTNALDEDADHSLGGFVKSAVFGGVGGAVTFGAGKFLAPVVSKLAAPIKAGIGKAWNSTSGKISSLGRTAMSKLSGGCSSFAASTLVVMADGSHQAIGEIEPGDKVLATNPHTGKQKAKKVTAVWVHDDALTDLKVSGETITTTEDHPFWDVSSGRFANAADIPAGSRLLDADGNTLIVEGFTPGTTYRDSAYNLTIAGIHTYHVGNTGVLVHNTGGCFVAAPLTTPQKSLLRAQARRLWASRTGAPASDVNKQIHHRIPLEWDHLTPGYANRPSNLVAMARADHSQVTSAWGVWKTGLGGRTPTGAEVIKQAIDLDNRFASLMDAIL